MRTVLIVEDSREAAEGLQAILAAGGSYTCYLAETGREAKEILIKKHPHICILDVTLPDEDGIELCRQIRRMSADILIIFVTATDGEDSLVQGFEAGGDDYLVKPFRGKELKARITALERRAHRKTPSNGCIAGDLQIYLDEAYLIKGGKKITLRPKEAELLRLLVERNGLLLKREFLYERLWGNEEKYVEENNLSVLTSRLRDKLGVYENKPYFETVWGIGYRWTCPIFSANR